MEAKPKLTRAGWRRRRSRSVSTERRGRKRWSLAPEWLEPRVVLDAAPIISEFMASNGSSLLDEDGDSSDWIEIYNTGDQPLDLAGWSLTDEPSNLGKWTFPSRTLDAGQRMVVFASSKDRTSGEHLHTNFQLAAGGGFLALVAADGMTVVNQFPSYPAQRQDISYGIFEAIDQNQLVGPGDSVRILIPPDGALSNSWTGGNEPLDDSTWSPATIGVGYDLASMGGDPPQLRVDFSRLDNGIAPLQSGWVGFAHDGTSPLTQQFLHDEIARPGSDVAVTIAGNTHWRDYAPATGQFAALSNLLSDGPLCNAACVMSLRLENLVDGRYEITTYHHTTQFGPSERPANAFDIHLTDGRVAGQLVADDVVMSDNGSATLSTRTIPFEVLDGSPVELTFTKQAGTDHMALPGFVLSFVGDPSVLGQVQSDIADLMHDTNASAYLRIPLQVDDPTFFDRLKLQIAYDDGFVAYLNGVEIARRNAPDPLSWNSTAVAIRPPSDAVRALEIDVTAFLPELLPGTNVLAIHGLNFDAADPDFLLAPQLWGVDVLGDQAQYFEPPTPGQPNQEGFVGFVADTRFSVDRGVFMSADEAFNVAVTTATEGATIVYTLDGSVPTWEEPDTVTNGSLYSGPIHIDRTTVLRAAAFMPEHRPSNTDTQTYLFLDSVARQPDLPVDYPNSWGSHSAFPGSQVIADYGMESNLADLARIAGDLALTLEQAREVVAQALRSLPSLSIVMEIDDLFGAQRGIYANTQGSGEAWERPASVELLPIDGSDAFQVDAGIRIQGFTSRDAARNPKHSLRLVFRQEYGSAELEYPFFGPDAASQYDTIVLRSNSQDAWVYDIPTNRNIGQFIRDQWTNSTQWAMGQPATHTNWVHLYLNGIYWGVYNPTERPDASFGATYFGGDKDDYDVLKNHEEVIDGNNAAYLQLLSLIQNDPNNFSAGYRSVASLAAYRNVQRYVDVPNLIDYMIHNMYAATTDWPGNNYILRNRVTGDGFKFFDWDSEHAMKVDVNTNRTLPHSRDADSPTKFHHALRLSNSEYRMLFADHLHRAFFNGGALYVDPNLPDWDSLNPGHNIPADRWMHFAQSIDTALIAESARWGDYRRDVHPYSQGPYELFTPHDQLLTERDDLLRNWFPDRSRIVLDQFRQQGLYPNIEAPRFVQHGGSLDPAAGIEMYAPAGVIYYTLDGADPRLFGGGVAPTAQIWEATSTEQALIPRGSEWTYSDTGFDPGRDWFHATFDDTAWTIGDGPFGYSDAPIQTVLTSQSTHYFRRLFDVNDASSIDRLLLGLRRDDGAVVYLNGHEVVRTNMPAGLVDFDTSADATVGGAEETQYLTFHLDPDLLIDGVNVLAVELHQVSSGASDASFDAELIATQIDPPVPLVLDQDATIKTRAYVGGQWSALNEATFYVLPAASAQTLSITEVQYHPHDPTSEELATDPALEDGDFEFIEVRNITDQAINLGGARFVSGIDFEFNSPTILQPGQHLVVVNNELAFEARYGLTVAVAGEFASGSLSNSGETIRMIDRFGEVIDEFSFDDDGDWPGRADGRGSSLEVIDVLRSLDDAENWRASAEYGGSPGREGLGDQVDVVINEVRALPDPGQLDAIELYNTSTQPIDIGGWYLSNSSGEYFKFRIPAGTVVPPGGRIVFDEDDFNASGGASADDFVLDGSRGFDVWLLATDEHQKPRRFADHIEFGSVRTGQTVGPFPDGSSLVAPLIADTIGGANAQPIAGPLVFSEIMYHPPETDDGMQRDHLEYVEIYNSSTAAVDLGGWSISGGIDYAFASGESLPSGQALVLLSFDPAEVGNAMLLDEFRAEYNLDPSALIFGGFTGRLSNGGERLNLWQAGAPLPADPGFTPRYLADRVRYDDEPPWPAAADGTGPALVRIAASQWGDQASNWLPDAPSPGSVSTVPVRFLSLQINAAVADPPDLAAGPQPTSWQMQRSDLHTLTLTFSKDVLLTLDDLQLVHLGINAPADPDTPIPLAGDQLTVEGAIVTIQFETAELPDGVYQLRLLETITDPQGLGFDGDSDGVAGGVLEITGGPSNALYKLAGDFNGDRGVTIFDFPTLSYWFGRSVDIAPSYVDLNADGGITIFDFSLFAANFNTFAVYPLAWQLVTDAWWLPAPSAVAAVEDALDQRVDQDGCVLQPADPPIARLLVRSGRDDDRGASGSKRPMAEWSDDSEWETLLACLARDVAGGP